LDITLVQKNNFPPFHNRSIKLASLYLAIMMLISLFFSLNVYQLSTQEFDRGIRSTGTTFNLPPNSGFSTQIRDQIIGEREQQFLDAKARVINRLIIINLIILVGGGVLSYYLALRTLRPIEEAQEAQSRFTADASHELRTPITAMRSENEVALMNPKLTLAQAKSQLKSNIEELEKLTDLSEGLLRLASLENGQIEAREVDPGKVITKALNRALPLAEKKGILIKTKVDTKTRLLGDESSLSEALVILLDNAIKYSPEHTEIELEAVQESKQIVFRVKDHGIGIKATEAEHIFDRFYRADTARSKQNVSGYGLGLAIAKNIVEMHKGSLSVTSTPGKGSTFTLAVPAKA
jgi:two-component system sensor histidine kinase CiaH